MPLGFLNVLLLAVVLGFEVAALPRGYEDRENIHQLAKANFLRHRSLNKRDAPLSQLDPFTTVKVLKVDPPLQSPIDSTTNTPLTTTGYLPTTLIDDASIVAENATAEPIPPILIAGDIAKRQVRSVKQEQKTQFHVDDNDSTYEADLKFLHAQEGPDAHPKNLEHWKAGEHDDKNAQVKQPKKSPSKN